jgi:hypothetical protein
VPFAEIIDSRSATHQNIAAMLSRVVLIAIAYAAGGANAFFGGKAGPVVSDPN